jgi:sugar phosphate permease
MFLLGCPCCITNAFSASFASFWALLLLECGQVSSDGEITVYVSHLPGMAYYLTLFYPPSRTGKRIGQYFTAAQVSAAVVGLVSAGFQKMDGRGGLVGFQWMFLLCGLSAVVLGIILLWWLPDRPLPPGETIVRNGYMRWLPASPPILVN